jgi:hypothetical protein
VSKRAPQFFQPVPRRLARPQPESRRCGIVLVLCLLAAACSTVNTEPFKKFADAAGKIKTGSAATFAAGTEWSQAGYQENLAADPSTDITTLVMQRSRDGWSMPNPAPSFMKVRQAQIALAEANSLLVNYANALVQLASGNLVSADTFDDIAKQLDANTSSVVADLANVSNAQSAAAIGLFSTAAAESARLYIENKRQAYLREAIEKNQDTIQKLSDLCVEALRHLSLDLGASYDAQVSAVSTGWIKLPRGSIDARQALIHRLLSLDNEFLSAEDAIKTLQSAYEDLPKAHADLVNAIEQPGADRAGLRSFYAEAQRLVILDQAVIQTSKGGKS